MPRLRVCLATDCYPPGIGGIENHVYCLAQGLARDGHLVDVVTHRDPRSSPVNDLQIEHDQHGFRVLRVPGMVLNYGGADPMADPRAFPWVHQLIRAGGYDIVHGHSLESLVVLAALSSARRLQIPALLTKHSMTVRASRPALANRLALAIEQAVARRLTQGLIVLSSAGEEEMAGAGVPVYRLRGGVDHEHWRPDSEAGRRIRAGLGWNDEHLVVGYLGRLVGSKGVPDLVEAVAPIMADDPRIRLLIVGDGPLREATEERLAELGLGQQACLAGAVPWRDTPAHYNAMDVFAFPSHTEAFGLVVLEAAACGVPAVARRNAGTSETIRSEETGVLVDGVTEMGRHLRGLIDDRERRRRWGKAARAMVEKTFSWRAIAADSAAIYHRVLSQATASGGNG